MKFKNIIKLWLTATLLLSFSACNKKEKEEDKKELKASLPKPQWEWNISQFGNSNGGEIYQNADHDPSSATKIGFAYSEELKDYEKAIEWYKYSNSMQPSGANSNYACYAYQQLKKFEDAISWCKQAIELGEDEALFRIAFVYEDLSNLDEAISWYKKSFEKTKDKMSANNLGLIYKNEIKDYKESEKWFKIAISLGDLESYRNLSNLYYDNLNDNIKASAYAIALIETKFSKTSVLRVLQEEMKIPIETIKKGYELQLNSPDFLIKYEGDLGLW